MAKPDGVTMRLVKHSCHAKSFKLSVSPHPSLPLPGKECGMRAIFAGKEGVGRGQSIQGMGVECGLSFLFVIKLNRILFLPLENVLNTNY